MDDIHPEDRAALLLYRRMRLRERMDRGAEIMLTPGEAILEQALERLFLAVQRREREEREREARGRIAAAASPKKKSRRRRSKSKKRKKSRKIRSRR